MADTRAKLLNLVAHELGTPLTPVRLELVMLLAGRHGALPEAARHAIQVIDRNVARIAALVNQIREVVEIQGDGLRFSISRVNVALAVAEVIDNFESAAKAVGVTIAVEAPPDLNLTTDRARLVQILANLVSNGLKFTPSGGEILVTCRATQSDVLIEVNDTGHGLDATQIDAIFQPFAQVHNTMQFTGPGAGLGLFISRGLAQAMGGTMTCESPGPNKGSTFRLVLPAANNDLAWSRVPVGVAKSRTLADRLRELI